MVQKTCKFCGKIFEAKRITAEFCSDNHRVQWNKKKIPPKGSLSNFLKTAKDEKPQEAASYQDRLRNLKLGIK